MLPIYTKGDKTIHSNYR